VGVGETGVSARGARSCPERIPRSARHDKLGGRRGTPRRATRSLEAPMHRRGVERRNWSERLGRGRGGLR
jgi:hypothetical protein